MTKNQINNLIFRQIEKKDLPQVYKLLNQLKQMDLKSIDQDKAWGSFSNNSSSNSLVGVFDDKIVAYGSVVIENKIRGEVCGHIEDIVVDKNLRKNMVGIRLVKELINILGLPAKMINSDTEVQEIRANRQEQQAQQAEMMEAMQTAKIAKDAAPAVQAINDTTKQQ